MAKQDDITTKYNLDISGFKKSINEANKQIKLASAQFKAASSGMENWEESSEGLSAKLNQLKSILAAQTSKMATYQKQLKALEQAEQENGKRVEQARKAYEEAKSQYGENSAEIKKYQKALNDVEKEQLANQKSADSLRITILNQQGAINSTVKDMRTYKNSLENVEKGSEEAERSVKDLNSELDSTSNVSKKVSDGFTVMRGAVASLVASGIRNVFGMVTDSIDSAMNRIDTMNQFSRTMTTMTGSTAIADKALKSITDTVTGTAYGLDVAAKSTQKFVTSGMGIDKATKQIALWGDAVSFYSDGTNDSFESVTDAISKMVAQGKVQGDQLDRLTDAGIPAVQLFADATGRSFADVRESLSNGKISSTEFIDVLEKAMNKGTKSFASIKGASKQAGSSWKGTIDNMKAAITRGVTAFIKQTEQALKKNKLPTIQELISKFGKTMEKTLSEGSKVVVWLTKNIDLVTGAVKTFVVALAVSKILSWTKSLSDAAKASVILRAITTKNTAATVTNTAAQTANTAATVTGTVATKAATIATRLFNAAWKSNPIGLVVSGLALLVTGMIALAKHVKETTKETDENIIATNKLVKEQKELTKTLNENEKARKDSMKSAEEEAGSTEFLFNKLQELNGIEHKTTAQKQLMAKVVKELNEVMPSLNLSYDKEADKLNKSTEAIKENIKAQKELVLAKAAEENLSKIAKDIVKTEMTRADLVKQNAKNEEAYNAAKSKTDAFRKKHNIAEIAASQDLNAEYNNLLQNEKKRRKAFEKTQEAVKNNKKELTDLNKEYGKTGDYAQQAYKNAEIGTSFAKIVEIAKKSGKEIPKALEAGIKDGVYAVPENMKQLNKLVNFDEALQVAGIAGKQIPVNISQGVITGKTSIDEAMKQINTYFDFEKAVNKAKTDGYKIPTNLLKAVQEGSISLQQANDQLNASIDLNKSVEKAKADGKLIPTTLITDLQNGKIGVKTASDLLNASMEFNSGVEKAKKAGIDVPKSIIDGMTSGELSVAAANTRLNNLVEFSKANKKSIESGVKIPKHISEGIASGEMSVKVANARMNEWIKFQEAINVAKESGAKVPKSLSDNVISGKTSVKKATESLNNAASNALKGMKGVGVTAGGDLIEGTKRGVNDRNKQNSVFSSIWNFGKSILSKFRGSLDEHSPSKTTKLYGKWLIDGLGIGIAKQEKSIVNQISKLGKNVLNQFKKATVNDNYKKLGENLAKSYKSGVDSSVKKSIQSVTDLVNATVNTLSKKNAKAKAQYKKAGTALISAYSSAIKNGASKAVSATESVLKNLGEKFQAQYDEIINKRETFYKKLAGNGSLFVENSDGSLFLGTLEQSSKEITSLGSKLDKLKKVLPNGLMEEIIGMDVQTGNKFSEALLSMNDKELKAYIKAYNDRETAAQNLSRKYYQSEINTLEKNFTSQVTKQMNSLNSKLNTIGKNAISGLIKGMNSKKLALSDSAKSMANEIVKTLKKQLKIKSPSRVMAAVSKWIPAGVAKGIDENVGMVKKSIVSMSNKAVDMSNSLLSGMNVPSLASGSSANSVSNSNSTNTNNFTQIINAPKQPSRIELYRQTRNLLELKGGS